MRPVRHPFTLGGHPGARAATLATTMTIFVQFAIISALGKTSHKRWQDGVACHPERVAFRGCGVAFSGATNSNWGKSIVLRLLYLELMGYRGKIIHPDQKKEGQKEFTTVTRSSPGSFNHL